MALLFVASPLAASDAFDSAVESSRTPGGSKSAESSGSSSSSSGLSTQNVASDAAGSFFAELFALIWLHNLCVHYAPYPYCFDGERFLVYEEFGDHSGGEFKESLYSVDSSLFYLETLGLGNATTLDCMFAPFIGLRAENLVMCETSYNPDISGYISVSLKAPLIQTNPFCVYVDLGASHWYGDVPSVLRGGFLGGIEFRSYPFKPLVLRLRICGQGYPDDVNITVVDASLGFMRNRWEFFAGLKQISVNNSASDEIADSWSGFSAGARLYW